MGLVLTWYRIDTEIFSRKIRIFSIAHPSSRWRMSLCNRAVSLTNQLLDSQKRLHFRSLIGWWEQKYGNCLSLSKLAKMADGRGEIGLVLDFLKNPGLFQKRSGWPRSYQLVSAWERVCLSPPDQCLRAVHLACSIWGSLQIIQLGIPVICKWSTWCLESQMICKLELSIQGSGTLPNHGAAFPGCSAFENIWGSQSLTNKFAEKRSSTTKRWRKTYNVMACFVMCFV